MPRRREPDALVFFVDRSLGRVHVVEALRAAGADVRAHDDCFPQNATDVEWLETAGRRGWVVLTKDDAIRRHPHEREMIEAANVRAFVLTRQNLSGPEMAEIFVAALPQIRRRCASTTPPFICALARNGTLTRLS